MTEYERIVAELTAAVSDYNRNRRPKYCGGCGVMKRTGEFKANRRQYDGLASQCKVCTAAGHRAYKARHTDRQLASQARWRERNRQHARDEWRKWEAANPVQRRQTLARRRARKRAVTTVVITPAQIAGKLAYWGGRCWICGGVADSLDHVKPISRGGAHMLANLRPACRSCNSAKGAKWPFDLTPWYRRNMQATA